MIISTSKSSKLSIVHASLESALTETFVHSIAQADQNRTMSVFGSADAAQHAQTYHYISALVVSVVEKAMAKIMIPVVGVSSV